MKDRFRQEIGAEGQAWACIDWKAQTKLVRNLRRRIFRATQEKKWNQVRSLMKLMLTSQSNLLLSIRAVTQVNRGRTTPGVDGEVALTADARWKLYQRMRIYQPWRVKPAKRVYVPKSNGKKRPLGIPALRDRILQAVVKNALEPTWEARFEASSYGFRPGRGVQDGIRHAHTLFNGRTHFEWVLEADIKGAFDNISHEFLMEKIGEVPGRNLIKEWLKAGYVELGQFHQTPSGTPQGGVISPLLANIALDGLEEIITSFFDRRAYRGWACDRNSHRIQNVKVRKYGYIRYADDFIIAGRTEEGMQELMPILNEWLTIRGLKLNEEKTGIRHIEEGFNFLGFTIRRVAKRKCLVWPEKRKVLNFLKGINAWLKKHPDIPTVDAIRHLNPRIRGFCNFYQYANSAEIFSTMQHVLWTHLWRWARRRHPKMNRKRLAGKYFGPPEWRLRGKGVDRSGREITYRLIKPTDVKITRHIKVKGSNSPDDPTLTPYWQERSIREGKTLLAKGSDDYRLAQRQEWKCRKCGDRLFNGEALNVHHREAVSKGGKDRLDNMEMLHETCHRNEHLSSGKD